MNPVGEAALASESIVERVRNQGFDSNTYLCETGESGKCILIDPGLDFLTIDAALQRRMLSPVAIFCTHGHFDHLGSVDFFQKKYAAKTYMHVGDSKLSQSANFLMMACKVAGPRISVPRFDVLFSDEGAIEVEGSRLPLLYHHTPGHTGGSCFLEYRGQLFTGDTLYRNAIGLVKLPGEDIDQLKGSLLRIWNLLDDSLVVHPGHGGSDRFGVIKKSNRPLREFLGFTDDGV